MSKQITTGTKITFKETNEKFMLTQTETGFDVRQIKLSKNVAAEHYNFQEFLDEYEKGNIAIDGFEDTDAGLVHSIMTNYIYQTNLKSMVKENKTLKSENETLKKQIAEQTEEILKLNNAISLMKEEDTV